MTIERGEVLLSQVLRAGVLLSAAIIILGIGMFFAEQPLSGYFGKGLAGSPRLPGGGGIRAH